MRVWENFSGGMISHDQFQNQAPVQQMAQHGVSGDKGLTVAKNAHLDNEHYVRAARCRYWPN